MRDISTWIIEVEIRIITKKRKKSMRNIKFKYVKI